MEFGAGSDVMTTRNHSEILFLEENYKNVLFVRVNPRDF